MQADQSTILQDYLSFIDHYRDRIKSSIQAESDHPRTWEPRKDSHGDALWTVDEEKELRALHIPALPTPEHPPLDPDLVLYRLGQLESLDAAAAPRLQSLLISDTHSLIVNTSGTGKTRMLLEVLSRTWGFYFTCSSHRVTSPYGSLDLQAALTDLRNNPHLHQEFSVLRRVSKDMQARRQRNQSIACKLIYTVILSRVLIFNEICDIGARLGIAEPVLRRRWLLVQLRPIDFFRNDIFSLLARSLQSFSVDQLAAELRTSFAKCSQRLQFIAIDEAQVAMGYSYGAFGANDHRKLAPVLHELVRCMASSFPEQRLLVAGTDVALDVVNDALSNLSLRYSEFRFTYSLGYFDTLAKTTAYLRHFFGETFGDDDCKEVHALFRGRFLAVFVQHVLNEGFCYMDRVMNTLLECLTGYSRPGPHLSFLPYVLILTNDQLNFCSARREARAAAFRFALLGEDTTFSENADSIVALSLGLFCEPDADAVMCEPIVFYRLLSWILESSHADISAMIRQRLQWPQSGPLHNLDFTAGLASLLSVAFDGIGRPLSAILTFEGASPFWTSNRARIVLPASSADDSSLCPGPQPAEYSLSIAQSPDDVFQWLRAGQQPFIIPDAKFGADVLFCLDIANVGTVLVAVFAERFHTDRPRRSPIVVPTDPASFYAESPDNQRKLVSILRSSPTVPYDRPSTKRPGRSLRYKVLRVLCFTRAFKRDTPYNPPVAFLDMQALLQLEHAPELSFSHLDDRLWGPSDST